ncbi:MAG: DUF1592 domain-containing protein [Pseudomonadota bacterium]
MKNRCPQKRVKHNYLVQINRAHKILKLVIITFTIHLSGCIGDTTEKVIPIKSSPATPAPNSNSIITPSIQPTTVPNSVILPTNPPIIISIPTTQPIAIPNTPSNLTAFPTVNPNQSVNPTLPPIPTSTVTPTVTPNATTRVSSNVATALPAVYGMRCAVCHGPSGNGGIAPKLIGFTKSYAEMTNTIRRGVSFMPAFSQTVVSTQDIAIMYSYFSGAPTPLTATPTPAPVPTIIPTNTPIEALSVIKQNPGSLLMYRLNKLQYTNTLNDLFGLDFSSVTNVLIADPITEGFDNIANTIGMGMNDIRLEQYYETANNALNLVFADTIARNKIFTCQLTSTNLDTCGRTIITTWSRKIWRKPASATEVANALNYINLQVSMGNSLEESVKTWMQAMLISTRFLHHVELNTVNSSQPYLLNPYEVANRLSYFLWCSMPDETLFNLAESGALLNNQTLEQQVERMLITGRSNCLVDSFATHWFELNKVNDKTILTADFPNWKDSYRSQMLNETKQFFMYLIRQNRPITELVGADYTFASDELAQYYGLTPSTAIDKRLNLINSQRRGLLTQGSILVATGSNINNEFIKRGIFTLDKLLCDAPPPPPPGIDTSGNTEASGCQGCHQYINPIGTGLNNFSSTGEIRTQNKDGSVINTSGNFYQGAAFNGSIEMINVLKQDERLPLCSAEKFFMFSHARALTEADDSHLQDIVNKWKTISPTLGMRDLIKSIVTSPTFYYRQDTTQ